MITTTLCYIEKEGRYLMLHRIKKEHDINKDKWIGVGGKALENESPEECVIREVFEETGLKLISPRLRAVITFVSDSCEGEYMYLFTAPAPEGELKECDEGVLEWVKKEEVPLLPIWEGDKLFLSELLKDRGFFTMKLSYRGDRLMESKFYIY